MISADIRFGGFDAHSWTNLISLFAPDLVARLESEAAESDDPEAAPSGATLPTGSLVVVVDERDRVLKSFHTARGRVTGLEWRGPAGLPNLCRTYGATRAIALREGVMDEMSERLAMRLSRGDDYVTQWLALWRIVREMQEAGLVHVWPRPLSNVPVPSSGTVRRALDLVLPDERSMVAMLWDGERPWTCVALRRRQGSIDSVVGPDLITRWTGPLGGDFRRDHRIVVDAVSKNLAPVHVGVFAQADTMRTLLRRADPGAWARAAAVRDVILHPAPPYAAVALGADAVRGVARLAAQVLGGLDVAEALAPVTGLFRNRVSQVASVSSTLGFNPLRALAAMLRRESPEDAATAWDARAEDLEDPEDDALDDDGAAGDDL